MQKFNDKYLEALRHTERGSARMKSAFISGANTETEEPIFLKHLPDIEPELSLIEEVKRIRDELKILDRLADDQHRVASDARSLFRTVSEPGYFDRAKVNAAQ
jgi:hypothetical protein